MSTDKNFDHNQANLSNKEDKHGACPSDTVKPVSVANSDILPRPKRKKRRAKADRGLPSDEELGMLVQIYLERQREHQPKIAEAGLLPEPSDEVVREMADDFKSRHRGGTVEVAALQVFQKFCSELGGNYNRFSCDNSDPLSIVDQMSNVLRKAQERGQFIPWSYVFCDMASLVRLPTVKGIETTKRLSKIQVI